MFEFIIQSVEKQKLTLTNNVENGCNLNMYWKNKLIK